MKRKYLISGIPPLHKFHLTLLFVFSFLFVVSFSDAGLVPGSFVTKGQTTSKRIALSFDDGPGPQTDKFIELLDRYNVKATFFMLGEQTKYRPLVAKAIAEKGHEIGNHTTTHLNYLHEYRTIEKKFGADPAASQKATSQVRLELVDDMKASRKIIEGATGVKLKICRMPHGIDRPWVNEAAREAGFIMVNWTYGADWFSKPLEELEPGYLKAIQPGAIFLFHDGGSRREKSLALTEAVIKAAKEKGFEIVTVGKLLGLE